MSIKIIRSDSNNVNEDALYEVFVDIIKTIQLQEEDTDEKEDDSVHEM